MRLSVCCDTLLDGHGLLGDMMVLGVAGYLGCFGLALSWNSTPVALSPVVVSHDVSHPKGPIPRVKPSAAPGDVRNPTWPTGWIEYIQYVSIYSIYRLNILPICVQVMTVCYSPYLYIQSVLNAGTDCI